MLAAVWRHLHGAIHAAGLVLLLAPCVAVEAAPAQIDCEFVYEAADGIFVNVGANTGLTVGSQGRLMRGEKVLARVEVATVSTESALLRFTSRRPGELPRAGERLTIVLDVVAEGPAQDDSAGTSTSPTLKDQTGEEERVFVPLLTPMDMLLEGAAQVENLFHGRVTLREVFQASGDSDYDSSYTRLGTRGSLERISGTPWTLDWDAAVSYRTGDALRRTRDHEEARIEVFRFAVSRSFADESSVRFGRFIPRELPSVGFLDGAQGEKTISSSMRVGGMLGLKPTRDDLNMTADEPTAVLYTTFELGDPETIYYTGTAGALASLFDGELDRVAALVDQRLNIHDLSILSSTEVDVEFGQTETYEDARISRWDIVASYPLASWLDLRAGLDRYALPDTEAERDLIDTGELEAAEFLESSGYWRYWIGATQHLPGRLRFSQEVSYTDSDDSDDDVRWMVSLSRQGLPGFPSGSVTLTVYNVLSDEDEGYGGRLTASLPALDGRLSFQPSIAFRYSQYDTKGATFFSRYDEDFHVADLSLRAFWMASRSWIFNGGVTYTLSSEEDRLLIDVGLTYKW